MVKSKSRSSKARMNINEILRIGSVMERTNIQQRSREAFDWLAENRDQMDNNPKIFANHLIAAVGELTMSKELIKKVCRFHEFQVMEKLIKGGIVTSNEYDKNFRRFEDFSDEQLPTVALISYIMKENCAYFQVDVMY
uniref:Phage protein n=1 Tax=Elaeophora elaphi TaxID=1147741 RepID=A0A0R3S3P0_9BILA